MSQTLAQTLVISIHLVTFSLFSLACNSSNNSRSDAPQSSNTNEPTDGDQESRSTFQPTEDQLIFSSIGDSISQGFGVSEFLAEDPSRNWATGEALALLQAPQKSIINRMNDYLTSNNIPKTVISVNVAETGHTTSNLDEQVGVLLNSAAPDFVSILIGANDLCSASVSESTINGAFVDNIKNAIRRLFSQLKSPKLVFVGSIPNIPRLGEIESDLQPLPFFTCELAWQTACPNIVDLSVSEFRSLVNLANNNIKEIVDTLASDGLSVVYDSGAVYEYDFTAADVASDCFHPSESGQRQIAKTVWDSIEGRVQEVLNSYKN